MLPFCCLSHWYSSPRQRYLNSFFCCAGWFCILFIDCLYCKSNCNQQPSHVLNNTHTGRAMLLSRCMWLASWNLHLIQSTHHYVQMNHTIPTPWYFGGGKLCITIHANEPYTPLEHWENDIYLHITTCKWTSIRPGPTNYLLHTDEPYNTVPLWGPRDRLLIAISILYSHTPPAQASCRAHK